MQPTSLGISVAAKKDIPLDLPHLTLRKPLNSKENRIVESITNLRIMHHNSAFSS
jgi:hypothetical protein